jgi:hypothetical protein
MDMLAAAFLVFLPAATGARGISLWVFRYVWEGLPGIWVNLVLVERVELVTTVSVTFW